MKRLKLFLGHTVYPDMYDRVQDIFLMLLYLKGVMKSIDCVRTGGSIITE